MQVPAAGDAVPALLNRDAADVPDRQAVASGISERHCVGVVLSHRA